MTADFTDDGSAARLNPARLNPAQLDAVQLLREPRHERPLHRRELRDELRRLLHDDLVELAAWIERPIQLSKHHLASVHGCEERFMHERQTPFRASAAIVRGTVAHKAIELSVHAPNASPGKLVDRALAHLTNSDSWAAQWLGDADELDRAEVRGLACDRVAKFVECFPPLSNGWRPITETRLSYDVHDGQIRLTGRPDLIIGAPDGMRAGKIIIDLKTGNRSSTHIEDLRFYALIETLRLGVPPWKVASYYLDSGTFVVETVSEGLLEAAARRTVGGAIKLAELIQGERPPRRQAGPTCSWCPLLEQCEDGQRARSAWEAYG